MNNTEDALFKLQINFVEHYEITNLKIIDNKLLYLQKNKEKFENPSFLKLYNMQSTNPIAYFTNILISNNLFMNIKFFSSTY